MQTKKNERSAKLFPQDLKLGQVHESMLLEITHFTKKRIEQKLKQKKHDNNFSLDNFLLKL